jgi:ribokinase
LPSLPFFENNFASVLIQGDAMAAPNKPIVVVGSINIDLVTTAKRIPLEGETVTGTGFQTHAGGKGANQAVAIGRLGYPVQMIGRLGDDPFGQQLKASLENAGVDISRVMTSPGTSGVAVILVGEKGENSIIITPGANGLLTPADIDENVEIIRAAGLVLAQLEIPLPTVLHLAKICKREDVPLILDPAPAVDLPTELFQNVTWFTPNETEAAFFAGISDRTSDDSDPAAISDKLLQTAGTQKMGIVLKLGARGIYIAPAEDEAQSIPPFEVKAKDTTAAGDAFNGAFATALMLGKSPIESAHFASAAAAISVTRAGAQPSMPTMAEVGQLLTQNFSPRTIGQSATATPSDFTPPTEIVDHSQR